MKSLFQSAGLAIAVTLIGGLAVSSVISMADEKTAVPEKKTESRSDARSADEKPSEEDVLKFAREHHPELAGLLEQLKASRPKEFNRAMKELSSQVARLDRTRDRMPARFDYELSIWKLESQTKLLAARWAMSQDPELEKQIRDLMRTRSDLKLSQLKADREKLAERLKSLDEQISGDESRREELIDEEFKRLTRQAGNARKKSPNSEVGAAPKAGAAPEAGAAPGGGAAKKKD